MRSTSRPTWLLAFAALALALAWAMAPLQAACSSATARGPGAQALAAGMAALQKHRRHVRKRGVWTLVDYDLPFTSARLWVLDRERGDAVLFTSRVSHAWKSGALFATRFSNRPGSNLSSPGSYVTARRTYEGRFGHSLRVRGLEAGVNDNAWKRDIVIHPALGTHSLGCFMLPEAHSARIIDTIVGRSFFHVHRSET